MRHEIIPPTMSNRRRQTTSFQLQQLVQEAAESSPALMGFFLGGLINPLRL